MLKGRDDSPKFFAGLRSGIPMRILASPVAEKRIPNFPHFLGYLQSLGALSFHAVLPRADITVWVYYRMLAEDGRRRFIASACAGVSSQIRLCSDAAHRLLSPVPSPLICTAIYLRKYLGCKEPLAFLSPCLLKWTEFRSADGEELVTYNATIQGIGRYLIKEHIDVLHFEKVGLENGGLGKGLTVGAFGGFAAPLNRALPGIQGRVELGFARVRTALSEWIREENSESLFEPYACANGCDGGSGVGNRSQEPATKQEIDRAKNGIPSREALIALFDRFDQELDLRDFTFPKIATKTQAVNIRFPM